MKKSKFSFVHRPMAIPLGTLEEVQGDIVHGPKFGSDINKGLSCPTSNNRSPEYRHASCQAKSHILDGRDQVGEDRFCQAQFFG